MTAPEVRCDDGMFCGADPAALSAGHRIGKPSNRPPPPATRASDVLVFRHSAVVTGDAPPRWELRHARTAPAPPQSRWGRRVSCAGCQPPPAQLYIRSAMYRGNEQCTESFARGNSFLLVCQVWNQVSFISAIAVYNCLYYLHLT